VKILVISSNLIGDNILCTGVVDYFSKKYHNSKFTFVIGPTAYKIYEHFPNLDKIIIIKKKKYNLHWLQIFKKTISTKWDIIIDFRSSLISYFLIKKKKYIFRKKNNLHHLNQLSNLFKFDCTKLKIYNDNQELDIANKTISNKFKHVVIFPGGNWKPKLWPVDNFNKLIKLIDKDYENIKFVIVGSLKEREIFFNQIINNIDEEKIIDLMGQSLTLSSAIMKKSNLFIGNDSGLMHLSSASDLNTIALFGPTNDKIYSPIGIKSFVIRTKESFEFLNKNIINENKTYMSSISPKEVIDLIKRNNLI